MRSVTFLSCLPVLERSPDVNSAFTHPLCGCRGSPVLQLEKGSVVWPPAATPEASGVRGAGLCVTPGTLTTLSWHATAHSYVSHMPFQVPSQVLHNLEPLSEEWLSPFLIHGLSQVLSKEAPTRELLFLVI